MLQDEALLLRKQALLQEREPRVLHRRSRKRRLLLQEGIVSDADAARTDLDRSAPAREFRYGDFTVSKTISGGTPKRTGTMLVPMPVVTKR